MNIDNTKSMYQQVADDLRHQIVTGELSPGQKLPTFEVLIAQYEVSRTIMQGAIAQLRELGFIRSDGRRGMFVEQYPPHLYRFGILFPGHPGDKYWSRFNSSLVGEAVRLQSQTPGYRFEFYYDLHKKQTSEHLGRLASDVENNTLAGVMEMPFCEHVVEQLQIKQSNVPLIHLFGSQQSTRLPSITTYSESVLKDDVLPWFHGNGCKRLAALNLIEHPMHSLPQLAQSAGLQTQRAWMQYVSREHCELARRMVWLLFEAPCHQRPDCLLIMDDNLIEHAMAGLVDCNLKPGTDVFVAAQHNWPCESPCMLPLKRYSFHAGQLLIMACRMLDQMRLKKTIPRYQLLPPLFEDQMPESVGFDDAIKMHVPNE